ncbi:MAG: hypothetical protein COA83_08690 [Methylophaga sp.]|nr:MAG: hypothetical protein COA83_08690 [Methylophaga sp.]
MNEFVTSSAEPGYLVPLALTTAPFNPTDDPRFFFKSEQIEQRINLLLHLIRASDKVALLFAKQGFGKSALLMQLQYSLGDDVRICRIDVEPSTEPTVLLLHCLRTLGVDDHEIQLSADHSELLRQRCQSLQNLKIKPLLLIDDAHQLSEESLAMILNCLSWQEDEQFLLQAVLTAKHTMPELNTIHGRIQRIDYFPIITETELIAYLMHRLTAAGYQGALPFKEKIVRHIFKKSAGNLELINQLAHQQLLGIKSVQGFKIFNLTTWFKWLGVGLLGVSIILLLTFQDNINKLFSPEENTKFDQLSEVSPEPSIAMVIADNNTSEMESLEKLLPTEAGIVEEEKTNLSAEKQGREELEALLAELPIAEPEGIVSQAEAEKTAGTDIKQIAEEALTSPKLKEKTATDSSEQWVLQQDSNFYTFQMMGSWDEEKVNDFIEKYELTGDLVVFKSKRSGRIWYALIYGVFESKEIAQQASNTWPETLQSLPKWLRQFESVQQQIQK